MIESWNELPLGTYRKITEINPSDEEGNLKILALLEDKPYSEILNAPIAGIKEKIKKIEFLNKKPKKHLVKTKYKLGDTTYVFNCSPSSVQVNQFIDFNALEEDDLTGKLAVWLIPEGKLYNEGYDLEKTREDIDRYLSVEEALSICDFFTLSLLVLLKRTLRRARKALRKAEKDGVDVTEARKELKRYEGFLSSSGSLL